MMMHTDAPLDGPGCGQSNHDDDCLCDVVVTKAAVIRIAELADLPFVQGTVERLQLGVPWTAADLESVMRIVLQAHDLRCERLQSKRFLVDDIDVQRAQVLELHDTGMTITEVMAELNLTFDQWRRRFIPGAHNPLNKLTMRDWLDLEEAVRDCKLSGRSLARRYGVSHSTLREAVRWLGLTAFVREQTRQNRAPKSLTDAEREQMKAWIREGLSPSDVKQKMLTVFDLEISRSLVSHTRRRMTEKGDL